MKTFKEFILEAKESIEIGGITFKEGDKIVYLKTYTDETDGEEYEEEISGTLYEIYPSKRVNILFNDNKHAVISSNDLVGKYIPQRKHKFGVSSSQLDKYEDQLMDIDSQINDILDEISQLENDMEEQIIDTARENWLDDNPDKTANDFNPHSSDADKYMDQAGSEWAETSGLNELEDELESLKKQKNKIQKKYEDYLKKDGKTSSSNPSIKYVKGYTPIE